MKRNTVVYYSLQLLGWGLYGLLMMLLAYLWTPDLKFYTINLLIASICGLVSHGMRTYFKHYQWGQKPLGWVALRLIVVNLVAAILSQLLIHAAIYTLMQGSESLQPFSWSRFVFYVANVMFVFWGWSLLYFGVKAYQRNRQNELEKWKLTAALKDAELMALKAQINPHFLFNALNNIRALVLEDGERARDMITHLSDLLRYSVKSNAAPQVPLAEELAVVQHYLTLESIQFENRLHYELDIPPETLDKPLPPMALQMLVENAIKHGIAQLPQGGTVRIRTRLEADRLVIEVENTGTLEAPSSEGLGIGLANIKERGQLLFGHLAEVSLRETDHHSVLASINLPLPAAL